MMMNRKRLPLLATTFLISIAYGAPNKPSDEASIPRANLVQAQDIIKQPNTYADYRKPIMLSAKQDHFYIALPTNPTTGYNWFVKSYTDNVLTIEKQSYQASNTDRVGAGGFTVWSIKLKPEAHKAAYMANIQLVYMRPWETKTVKPVQFTIYTATE